MKSKILVSILNGIFLGLFIMQTHNGKYIDPRIKRSYDKFIFLSKECGRMVNENDMRIEMESFKGSYYAMTYPTLNLIVVNSPKFNLLNEYEKEQTIIHELGHAMLKLQHDDKSLNLMNTYDFIEPLDYTMNFDYYVRKLFKDCKRTKEFKYEE